MVQFTFTQCFLTTGLHVTDGWTYERADKWLFSEFWFKVHSHSSSVYIWAIKAQMTWTARCGRPPLLPSGRKLEFRLSALIDSDLTWLNGKSGRKSWRYADALQRSIISEAIYHFIYFYIRRSESWREEFSRKMSAARCLSANSKYSLCFPSASWHLSVDLGVHSSTLKYRRLIAQLGVNVLGLEVAPWFFATIYHSYFTYTLTTTAHRRCVQWACLNEKRLG